MSSALDLNVAAPAAGVADADMRFAWRVGFLVGLPIAVPAPPLYLFGFACFFVALFRWRLLPASAGISREFGLLTLIVLALLSNLIGLTRNDIDPMRIITTSFFFLLFLFPRCITDKRAFLLGFCHAMLIWAALIVAMAFYMRIWDMGLLLFSMPDFRLWGANIFPDWPNYMAFMLSLASLFNIMVFKRPGQATLLLVAALLTTSRTPMIALILLITGWLLFRSVRTGVATLLAIGASIAALTLIVTMLLEFELDSNLLDRLLVFDDRDDIYSFALVLVQQSPWIGYGGVLLDESIGFSGHPSFHNSYLDIAVRHGLPALAIFLLLLVPPRGSWRQGGWRFALVVVFVLVGSVFQNFLKHPHILMLYTVLIETSMLYRGRSSER